MALDERINLVGVDEVMSLLGVPEERHAEVERLVNWASQLIERETGTAWKPRIEVRVYDAPSPWRSDGGTVLDLGSHVTAVIEVKLGGGVIDDYVFIQPRGCLFRRLGWVAGMGVRNIEVKAVYGVGVAEGEEYMPAVPHDVVQACIDLVAWRLRGGGGASGDLASERIGDYSYTRRSEAASPVAGIPADIAETLVSRRRW